jgi:uncharacterized membrane protein SirB2
MSYALLKTVHMSCAAISYVLFVLRGIWRFSGSSIAEQRWTRIVPHVNDTVLLAAALGMVAMIGYHAFLTAKIAGLIAYILLGITAFRWARSTRSRLGAWLAAQLAFFYIVAVAFTRSPILGL